MSIRRIQYQLNFVHILTFKDEYKKAIAPHFGFDNLDYAIENEGTIHEGIRLVYKNEKIAIVLKKEAIGFVYEGDVNDLKNPNSIIGIFWDLYEKIKLFVGYTRTIGHMLIVHSVELMEAKKVSEMLTKNPFLSLNPFGKLDEFACVSEFKEEDLEYKVQLGNFTEKDIKKHELGVLKSEFNKDLQNGVGIMARVEIIEREHSPTQGKYRHLISKALDVLKKITVN